jgi:hypothetical protein
VGRRATAFIVAAAAIAAGALTPAAAPADDLIWRLEQPPPPQGAPFKVPLGAPGELSFWAPNRGLMTVEGNDTIPRGIFSWDGESWHQLATVCGGSGQTARIAWAGPREFWVVSVPSPPRTGSGLALCRFKDGQVVGSFSTRPEAADPFFRMQSAACNGADDCWFGGIAAQDPLGERIGAFHLHWDGQNLNSVYGPQGRAVSDMEVHEDTTYESVHVGKEPEDRANDIFLAEPEPVPRLIHAITGTAFANDAFEPAPLGGVPVDGTELLALDSDGANLWAVGGGTASGPSAPQGSAVDRPPLAARLVAGSFQEVTPTGGTFGPLTRFTDVAAIPGTNDAFATGVPFGERQSSNAKATVARIEPDGTTTTTRLPVAGSGRGSAARIACPAPDDCWLATYGGWLFHYSDGHTLPRDTDPAFQGTIEFRPNETAEQFVPDTPPVDDSQLFAPPPLEPADPQIIEEEPVLKRVRAQRKGRRLVVKFKVTRPATVQLVGKRRGKVVAKSHKREFDPGSGKLAMRVDFDRYPTKLAFKVSETE